MEDGGFVIFCLWNTLKCCCKWERHQYLGERAVPDNEAAVNHNVVTNHTTPYTARQFPTKVQPKVPLV
jgi:hypothetical protein